jgi:hypothetical protein
MCDDDIARPQQIDDGVDRRRRIKRSDVNHDLVGAAIIIVCLIGHGDCLGQRQQSKRIDDEIRHPRLDAKKEVRICGHDPASGADVERVSVALRTIDRVVGPLPRHSIPRDVHEGIGARIVSGEGRRLELLRLGPSRVTRRNDGRVAARLGQIVDVDTPDECLRPDGARKVRVNVD